jgi:hypothetical protein
MELLAKRGHSDGSDDVVFELIAFIPLVPVSTF